MIQESVKWAKENIKKEKAKNVCFAILKVLFIRDLRPYRWVQCFRFSKSLNKSFSSSFSFSNAVAVRVSRSLSHSMGEADVHMKYQRDDGAGEERRVVEEVK